MLMRVYGVMYFAALGQQGSKILLRPSTNAFPSLANVAPHAYTPIN